MSSPIISAEEVERHLGDWIVIDCRHSLQDVEAGRRAYQAGHIPGAIFFHLDQDLSGPTGGERGRHPLPSIARWVETLEQAGVSSGRMVVAYDDREGLFAARLWWMLRWVGHEQVAVLDGGWAHWCGENRPVSTEPPSLRRAVFLARERQGAWIDTAAVQEHLNDPDQLLLDARTADRFRGENETLDPVGGHIPGARNRPFRDNLQADGRFKPAEQLKAEFEALLSGAAPAQVVHQCGSGVTACHNLLAMEYAGLQGGRLYPGSWSAWCANPTRPVAVGSP
ncbi:MAG: sulfurtransferase [Betaproteobacteria bacterium]|nr:sulfurtransferase [Betaproteobacteria bacterium]MDE2621617.1 sulfurtransferase [Betaproteobacteria bacterium]